MTSTLVRFQGLPLMKLSFKNIPESRQAALKFQRRTSAMVAPERMPLWTSSGRIKTKLWAGFRKRNLPCAAGGASWEWSTSRSFYRFSGGSPGGCMGVARTRNVYWRWKCQIQGIHGCGVTAAWGNSKWEGWVSMVLSTLHGFNSGRDSREPEESPYCRHISNRVESLRAAPSAYAPTSDWYIEYLECSRSGMRSWTYISNNRAWVQGRLLPAQGFALEYMSHSENHRQN
ncbi:hypothetical protein PM082_020571 [Marasmius tenuissimus]|nr:hypothetical protein PM082_020571 [Marasmius tenuissimus]